MTSPTREGGEWGTTSERVQDPIDAPKTSCRKRGTGENRAWWDQKAESSRRGRLPCLKGLGLKGDPASRPLRKGVRGGKDRIGGDSGNIETAS